jgi:hypothetical protein
MMLTCRQFTRRVTDLLEGRLSRWEQRAARFHLLWCRNCPRFLAQMKATIKALRDLPQSESESESASAPPPDRRAELLKRFREMRH